jgi:hypothetical protein
LEKTWEKNKAPQKRLFKLASLEFLVEIVIFEMNAAASIVKSDSGSFHRLLRMIETECRERKVVSTLSGNYGEIYMN